jgi:Fe-S-cluster containining protein
VLLWNIENKECPFLDEKQCIIYENRPLVCRAFPVVSTGIHGNRPMMRSMLCPQEIAFTGLGEKDKLSIALKKLINRYGENFLSCYLLEKIEENEKNVLEILIKEEKIKPRKEKRGFRFIGLMEYFRKNEISDESYEKGLAEEIKTLSKTNDEIKQLSSMADKMEKEFVKK